jgi:hypothetical protein
VAEIAVVVVEVKQAAQGLVAVCSTVELEAYQGGVDDAGTLLTGAEPTSVGSLAPVAVVAKLEGDSRHVAAGENAGEDEHVAAASALGALEGAVQTAHHLLMSLRAYVAGWRSRQFY